MADVTTVRVEGRDGAGALARLFLSETPRAALAWMPAMGVSARAYDAFGAALAARGVSTLVSELRGGEGSEVRPRRGVDFGLGELIDDHTRASEVLAQRVPGVPVHVGGHSLGGQLTVVHFAARAGPETKLVLVASGTVHFRAWGFPRNLGVLVGTQVAAGVAKALDFFPGHRLGFGGRQSRRLIEDWARASRTGRYGTRTHALETGLDAVTAEVLAVHVDGDTMAPLEATRRLLAKLPRARVQYATAPAPLEPRRLNPHFRWTKGPDAVAEVVARFLVG
ncbi:MAG: alpha/beta hydrolase [Myxococcota bacterium]